MEDKTPESQLDRFGSEVLRSAAMSDSEVEALASSPFLYSRVRARIERERRRRTEPVKRWLAPLATAWQAIPALGLVAAGALAALLLAHARPPAGASRLNSAPQPDIDRLARVTACSVSNNQECAVSIDDVVRAVVENGAQETKR